MHNLGLKNTMIEIEKSVDQFLNVCVGRNFPEWSTERQKDGNQREIKRHNRYSEMVWVTQILKERRQKGQKQYLRANSQELCKIDEKQSNCDKLKKSHKLWAELKKKFYP